MEAGLEDVDVERVEVGDELPVLTKPPITRTTLAYFCGASNDHNPIHVDSDFARAAGKDDVFAHGMLDMAYMGQLLTNWVLQSSIVSFEVKFAAIVYVGDEITCRGVVSEKIVTDTGFDLKIKLKAVDQHEVVKLTGEAVIRQALK
ncbi:MAG: MaoC family dehydratase [Porticoccaceae bacterium]|nr:MaoC family dehydratase [Porticoccaceae bacterium]